MSGAEEKLTPPPPQAEDDAPMADPPAAADSDDDSVLSDLDDEAFNDYNEVDMNKAAPIPIDEDTVGTLGKHKRKPGLDDVPRRKEQRRRKRDRSRGRRDDDDLHAEPIIELTEEEKRRQAIERQMDEAVKGPKKKKKRKNEHDLEKMDDEHVENLKYAMVEAAENDAIAVQNGKPATGKIGMINTVRDSLSRTNLLNVALDGQILIAIKKWLEPLPNRTLPAYAVQKLMFEILARLRPETEHLRESGIGKIVMFYTKDSRPEMHIKREAERLVRDWSRPILGRSDDYRSREVPIANGSNMSSRPAPAKKATMSAADALAAPVRDTGRARVLLPSSQSYEIAPQSKIAGGYNQFARPVGAAGDDFIRKMKAKKAAKAGRGRVA